MSLGCFGFGAFGSPPRMRERLNEEEAEAVRFGITPAYAGKTQMSAAHQIFREDHPRVCGKDYSFFSLFSLFNGSPPRMRERLSNTYTCYIVNGITPAYAGKTYIDIFNYHPF